MQKTKSIWASLSTVIRGVRPKTTTTTSRLAHFSPNSPIPSLSSLLESSHKVPPRNVHDFPPNSKFPVQNFSSHPPANLESTTKRCYKCCATITAPFMYCESCQIVQPVDSSIDYFQILGEEKKLEHRAVQGKFFDLIRKYRDVEFNPKFDSEEQRKHAIEQSELLAKAAIALKDPMSRAKYMLKLEGVHLIATRNFTDPEYRKECDKWNKAFKSAKYDFTELSIIKYEVSKKLYERAESFLNAYQRRNFDEAATCFHFLVLHYDDLTHVGRYHEIQPTQFGVSGLTLSSLPLTKGFEFES